MKNLKIDREYLGVTVTAKNYREIVGPKGSETEEGRQDLRFHEKHLRAYLKGKDSFTHGWVKDEEGNTVGPQFHDVQQEFTVTYKNTEDKEELITLKTQARLQRLLQQIQK